MDHARKAVQAAPEDVEAKGLLLLFFELEPPLIGHEEAVELAFEILASDPDHELAQQVLMG